MTAYYAREMGINLEQADFVIKSKRVEVPTDWQPDLRRHNLSGEWTDIGLLSWRNNVGRLTLESRPNASRPRDQKDTPRSLGTPTSP